MRLKLGNWAGGADGVPEGTVAWAGGRTDFDLGPFDMYVQDVSIINYNPADSYEYGDKTGSWQSIKINKDGSSSNASGSSSSDSSSTLEPSTSASSASSTTGADTTSTKPEQDEQSSTATDKTYTSPASVEPLDKHTEAAVSVTQTGSMYSTNTASASALNSAIAASSTLETAVSVSTQVPDSKPTGASTTSSYGNAGNSNWTHNNSTVSASPAEQTTNAAFSLRGGGVVAASVAGLALGVMLL
jgi:hypothetical protein